MEMKMFENISTVVGRGGLLVKKYSPELLLGAGIIGGVGAAFLACKATLGVERVIGEHNIKRNKIEEARELIEAGDLDEEKYPEAAAKKDIQLTYVQTGIEFVKLYGPAVTLGAASLVCIIASHGIMKKRNVALVAAYKVLEEGFENYRKRVIEEHGEEVDYMYRHNLKAEEVVETEVGEDGKSKKVKSTRLVPFDPDVKSPSIYARFFDETNPEWLKTPEYNLMFLKGQEQYANQLLRSRGHIFLNEVYDSIGIPRSKEGAVVGWVLGMGDDYVDFGIFDGNNPKKRDFVNGYERSILLDFNVAGTIWDKI